VTEVAVTVTVAGLGAVAGAVYVIATPLAELAAEKVPQVAPEQPGPLTVHVTPRLLGSLASVAANSRTVFTSTPASVGATVTETDDVMVRVAAADFLASATDVAVTITVDGLGTAAGAVYVIATPLAELVADRVPQVAPEQPSLQVTPALLGSLVSVAVSCCGPFTSTRPAVGVRLTTMSDVMVTVAAANRVLSVTEVAVMVTLAGLGQVAGAV